MRFLIFSDLHVHNHPDFDVQVGDTSSRLQDCLQVLDKVKRYYDKYKCNAVLFCGDMFHTPNAVETNTYEPAYRKLEQLTDNVDRFIAIAGNHDKADTAKDGTSYSSVYPMTRLTRSAVVVKTPITIKIGRSGIHCLPYIKDVEEFREKLSLLRNRIRQHGHNILLVHQDLREAPNGPNEIRLKKAYSIREIAKKMDYVFCGHHHHPYRLNSTAVVVGSPIQHNMLDRGDKRGIIIYDTQTEQVKRIWFTFSRFFLFEIESPAAYKKFSELEWEHGIPNGYVRFIFRYPLNIDEKTELEEHLKSMMVRGYEIKVQPGPTRAMRNESLSKKMLASIGLKAALPDYVDHVKPKGLNRKRLVKTGQKIIDSAEGD